MNKPDYLTQEQYNQLFKEVEEINPSWRFIRSNRTTVQSMTVWEVWINAVIRINGSFRHISDYSHRLIKEDEDLMRQVNDYIILIQL